MIHDEKEGTEPSARHRSSAYPDHEGLPNTKSKRGVRVKSVGKGKSQEGMRAEYTVSIRSRRVRLLDPDNLYCKDVIDQLRYAGVIPEDTPEVIEIDITQEKVSGYKQEETIIEVRRNGN